MALTFKVLAKKTFTAVASVSLDNVFSATYNQYKIIGNFTSSAETTGILRMRVNGSDNSSNEYNTQRINFENTTTTGARNTNLDYFNSIMIAPGSDGSSQVIEILSPYQSVNTTIFSFWGANATLYLSTRCGCMTVTTAYDGFTIAPGSGTLTGSITVLGYGI